MYIDEYFTTVERAGLVLGLLLLALGVAELADTVSLVPMKIYVVVPWVISVTMWLYEKHVR